MSAQTTYVPALGVDWLTPFYDVTAWLVGEHAFKQRLIDAAALAPGHDVLDLGCGTGTLVIMAKEAQPGARVVGMDLDPPILDIARRKIAQRGLDIPLHHGSAIAPPFAPASFDRIFTTLMLHHLTTAEKAQTFAATRALLRAGGELHVADWGPPHNWAMWLAAQTVQWFDGADRLAANLDGKLPGMLRDAGFARVTPGPQQMTPFGTLAFLHVEV